MPNRYTYRVSWSDEDQTFIARCTEFPSLGTHGPTQVKAIEKMHSLITFILKDMSDSGEKPPGRGPDISYKNKFGATDIKRGNLHNVSISWDYDTNPKQIYPVLLHVPDTKKYDREHHHIKLNKREARVLRDWLSDYLDSTTPRVKRGKERLQPKEKSKNRRRNAKG